MSRLLSGTGQYGLATADLFSRDADFSIAIWFKPTDTTTEQMIFGQDQAAGNTRYMGIHTRGDQAGDPASFISNSGAPSKSDFGTPTYSDWNIAVITKVAGAGACNGYINSETPTSLSTSSVVSTALDHVAVSYTHLTLPTTPYV